MRFTRVFILLIFFNVSYSITYLVQVDIIGNTLSNTILQLAIDHMRDGVIIDSTNFSISPSKDKEIAQTVFTNFHRKDEIRIVHYSLQSNSHLVKKYIKSTLYNVNIILDYWFGKSSKDLKNLCLKFSNNELIVPANPYYPKTTHIQHYSDNISARCNFKFNNITNTLELEKEDIQFNKNY